jgi:uncharacterized membrane protein
MLKTTIAFLIMAMGGCQTTEKFIDLPKGQVLLASGNEPGWIMYFERNKTITWITNYGKDTIKLNAEVDKSDYSEFMVGEVNAERLHFIKQDITIDVKHSPCENDMSDQQSLETVIIMQGDKTFRGCGRYKKI